MTEIWKPVLGYEDCYAVSDQGNVARTSTYGAKPRKVWKPLALVTNHHGYITAHICKNGVRKKLLVHRLVWEAFKERIPADREINHLSGVKAENCLSNLELCTSSDNMIHSFRVLGRPPSFKPHLGSDNGCSKLSESDIPKIIALYQTGKYRQIDIGKMYGVSQRMISLITRREKWRHVPPQP